MKKLQAKPFRGLLQLLASYLNNLSRRHSLLVCPVLFECFDHNRSRSTSNHSCCHISTRVCLLSILLWTPYPCFFPRFLRRRWLSWTCACWLLWLFCLWLWCMGLFATHIFYFCIFILTFIFFLAALFSSSFFLFKNCLISILLEKNNTARGFVFILCK